MPANHLVGGHPVVEWAGQNSKGPAYVAVLLILKKKTPEGQRGVGQQGVWGRGRGLVFGFPDWHNNLATTMFNCLKFFS